MTVDISHVVMSQIERRLAGVHISCMCAVCCTVSFLCYLNTVIHFSVPYMYCVLLGVSTKCFSFLCLPLLSLMNAHHAFKISFTQRLCLFVRFDRNFDTDHKWRYSELRIMMFLQIVGNVRAFAFGNKWSRTKSHLNFTIFVLSSVHAIAWQIIIY